jgi:N-acetylglucosaminyldiphosphoundecaprenol N-acetyl-beta-D-mannosaminyltransferase
MYEFEHKILSTNKPEMNRAEKKKMNMLGIEMDCLSYNEMFSLFDQWLTDKSTRSHTLSLINVNCCVSALFDKRLRAIYNSTDIVGIDSMPFLLWARTFYNIDSNRLYAPDLLSEISSKAKDKKYTFYFYGGYSDAPDKVEAYLMERFQGIQVVGKDSPPFRELTIEEEQSIIDKINCAQPDFLWIGLGSPKQDIWIYNNREKIRGSIIIPAGATFDFLSGRIKQAPKLIRDLGFEWLYRLTQDSRRLLIRYTAYNLIFVVLFTLQLLGILRFEPTNIRYNSKV